jgi:hypothetical protein
VFFITPINLPQASNAAPEWQAKICKIQATAFQIPVLMRGLFKESSMNPSDHVDQVWRLHLLFSKAYWHDCYPRVLGRAFQHHPSRSGAQQQAHIHQLYRLTIESCRRFFASPPVGLWPALVIRFDRDLQTQRGPINRRGWGRLSTGSAVSALGLMVALLLVSGLLARAADDAPPGQPQDLPMRLALFAIMALTFYRLGRWISPSLRGPSHQATIPALDPEQLAYLVRGASGVMELALARLVDKGILQADPASRAITRRKLPGQPLSQVEQLVLESYESLSLEMYGEIGVPYRSLISSERFFFLMGSGRFIRHSLQTKRLLLQLGPLMLMDYLPILGIICFFFLGPATSFVSVASVLYGSCFLCLGFASGGRRTRWGDKVVSFYRECDDLHDRWLRVGLDGPDARSGGSLDQLRELIRIVEADKAVRF